MQQTHAPTDEALKKFHSQQLEGYQTWLKTDQARRDQLSASQAKAEVQRQEVIRTTAVMQGAGRDLPPMPEAPPRQATFGSPEQRAEREQRSTQLLQDYRQRGQIATPAVPNSSNYNAADHYLQQEHEFRDRQKDLASQITETKDPQERERLSAVKSTEYHAHKAEQLERILNTQDTCERMGGGPLSETERAWKQDLQQQLEDHRAQGAVAIEQLERLDKAKSAQTGATVEADHEQMPAVVVPAAETAVSQSRADSPAAVRLQQRQEQARGSAVGERTPQTDRVASKVESASRELTKSSPARTAERERERTLSHGN